MTQYTCTYITTLKRNGDRFYRFHHAFLWEPCEQLRECTYSMNLFNIIVIYICKMNRKNNVHIEWVTMIHNRGMCKGCVIDSVLCWQYLIWLGWLQSLMQYDTRNRAVSPKSSTHFYLLQMKVHWSSWHTSTMKGACNSKKTLNEMLLQNKFTLLSILSTQ